MTTRRTQPDDAAAHLAAIVESSDDAIISKTLEGYVTSWNPAAERIFGYTAAEAIGRHITFIVPDELHAEEDDILARIRRGERIEHFETVREAKGGRRLDVLVTESPVKDSQGQVIGTSKIAHDVTEQRRGAELQARLAAIVDSSDDVIVGKTLDGRITSWNRAAERTFGYTAAEAVGQHITLIIPEERRAEEDDVLARIGRGEKVDHFETIRQRKDGRRIPVSLTVSPIKDPVGRIIGASKIARDISERHRAEQERNELLAREQAAREHAEVLNRAKDEFLAVLSHELRTPLNAVFGWAKMLRNGLEDPRVVERATDAITRNAAAQIQLINDLLDVSRIITGKMRLDVRPVDLEAVIDAALETVQPAASAKAIRLQRTVDPGLTVIIGAPDRLQQVVWNLLMNAVKFTPRGGQVQVVLRRVNSQVEIVVSDTGAGIDADVLPHVFERFRQGDSSTTRAHGGLGLGLALVRHLVDLHGGTVTAESEGAGKGATFTVRLPVAMVQRGGPPAEAADLGAEAGETTPPLRGLRVLLVDDDAEGLELATLMLVKDGADVKAARSVPTALEAFEDWRPDVVLCDIEMPGEDGVTFLRKARALETPRAGKTPIIALTAYGRPDDRTRLLAAGFDQYLAKPVDPAELTLAVANAAGRTG